MRLQQGFATGEIGFKDQAATQRSLAAHVRFGSKADIGACPRDVRFTPKALEHRVVVSGFFGDRLDDIPMFDDLAVFQLVNIHDGITARARVGTLWTWWMT